MSALRAEAEHLLRHHSEESDWSDGEFDTELGKPLKPRVHNKGREESIERYVSRVQYVCGELRDFLYCTRDHVSSNKVSDMENTAPSLDVSRKRKANVRDPHSDIGTKKKLPAKPRRALCKSAKRSVSNALEH